MYCSFFVSDSSAVDAFDDLLHQAIDNYSSDIHLEPRNNDYAVKIRVDGVLYEATRLAQDFATQLISRIKVLAHLDIAQRRLPQDGKIMFMHQGRMVDLRVSTFPSYTGETCVLRILDAIQAVLGLQNIGMAEYDAEIFINHLNKQYGCILVTGPTGSGKTSTLYSALKYLNTGQYHIITLEDPVEYHIDGVTQGQIVPNSGFTFAKGIRSMLRQDPDIVFIGEIRDVETVATAIEASLTGHLVLSSLHTTDAPGAIIRLLDMGIEPFLINATIRCIIAQRLVRRLCQHCKRARKPKTQEQEFLSDHDIVCDEVFEAIGCQHCLGFGYKGRIGVFELLTITENLKEYITHHPRHELLYEQALHSGMKSMLKDAGSKLQEGVISFPEISRLLL